MVEFAIVLGTTKSGSNAVFEYLAGRRDLYDPLQGAEYMLPQSPYGLMNLLATAGQAFHYPSSEEALSKFEKLVIQLYRKASLIRFGRGYQTTLPWFLDDLERFVDRIVAAELPLRLTWKTFNLTPFSVLLHKARGRVLKEAKPQNVRLLHAPETVLESARRMHYSLFSRHSGGKPTLLNQAGSGWNPDYSTVFFSNRRVIVVVRDPRDQFAELKQLKGSRDVTRFVAWAKSNRRRLQTVDSEDIVVVHFEEFIQNYQSTVGRLCDFLEISEYVESSFRPEPSTANIGKYQYLLSREEIRAIENGLMK